MRPSRLFPLAGLLTALALLVPSLASADTSSSLTVVGTSDVSDSGLMQNLIQPEFHQQFPGFTFKYVGSATGAAIASAQNGTGGPSVLIVHAASLENSFVSGGYSYNNAYGSAIFTNDFVLAGAPGDPAGVAANGAHNIAQAFADVASAGANGKATFVSRGGTGVTSGTTVEEHQIWALVNSSGLKPASLTLCNVSTQNGGGMAPVKSGTTLDSAGDCPDGGEVTAPDNPSWYDITSLTQGPNVVATNACTVPSGAGSCYVLTDRGTYDYLASGQDTAGTIPNLTILTRDNDASAPGGADALINYFHAYIINPSKAGEQVNLTAAQDFVNFLQSAAFQQQLSTYLDVFPYSSTLGQPAQDPGGAPFKPDASPSISAPANVPTGQITTGTTVTLAGQVTNNQPGYAAIAQQPVILNQVVDGVDLPVDTATTNSTGGYSFAYKPTSTGTYQVTTKQISQVEIPTLSPVYGDVLAPGASPTFTMAVTSGVSITSAKPTSTGASVAGLVSPAAPNGTATVTIQARKVGTTAYTAVGNVALTQGQASYATNVNLPAGKWQLVATYQDPGTFTATASPAVTVTVAKAQINVSIKGHKVKKGKLTVSGKLSAAPTAKSTVKLFALSLKGGKFKQIGKATVKSGKTTFSISKKLAKGKYFLQLSFKTGSTTTFSKVSKAVKIG